MANRHYAKIGDVWKHLVLTELLRTEIPAIYWESHAGAADYRLSHSLARDYGAYYFFQNAQRSELLRRSSYHAILRRFASGTGEPQRYPGSPRIAMEMLKDAASRFLFCDLDQDSLSTIRQRARELGLAARVETEHANGVTTLRRKVAILSQADAPHVFAPLDPYLPFARDDDGRDCADLFCELTAKGARVMLWYGFGSEDELAVLMKELRTVAAAHSLRTADHRIWRGEIVLAAMHDSDFDINPGVMGCGVLCSNIGANAVSACAKLGQELARIYSDARFPEGSTGALQFRQSQF
jgi:23S rRNA A2030 N6-methylase RlmJ